MPRPFSNAQIDRLGGRLIAGDRPTESDLQLLHELLAFYGEVLDAAVQRVRIERGLSPSFRLKNTGTILEKLRRQGGTALRNMQDLAGMRIVGDLDLRAQDMVAGELAEEFSDEVRKPKIVDRRTQPRSGYRAVHIIVFPNQIPVEIQLRTRWQHEWADMFEKLADRLGRGIRYGEPPTLITREPGTSEQIVDLALQMSDHIYRAELDASAGRDNAEVRRMIDTALGLLGEMLDHL